MINKDCVRRMSPLPLLFSTRNLDKAQARTQTLTSGAGKTEYECAIPIGFTDDLQE